MSVTIENCKSIPAKSVKIGHAQSSSSFAQSLQHNVKPFSNYAEGIGGA